MPFAYERPLCAPEADDPVKPAFDLSEILALAALWPFMALMDGLTLAL
jgi:hypothetical protein